MVSRLTSASLYACNAVLVPSLLHLYIVAWGGLREKAQWWMGRVEKECMKADTEKV